MMLPQSSVVPSPADFAAYLRSRQWQFGGIQANWALYTLDPENTAVEVPQLSQSRDYSRVAAALLEELSRIEHRAAAQILREVLASTTDVVRLSLRGSTMNDGRIPVEAGLAAYDGARNLLLAAACSALDRRSAHARRKPDAAMKLLQRVRFGQTEVGSFVLTMESSVPPLLQGRLIELPDEETPLERKTSLLLATALRETQVALQEAAATGSIEPFRSRTPAGLSANLCDALVELIRDTQADQLSVSVSYAHHRPVPPIPAAITFGRDAVPFLSEAATGLRGEASYPAYLLAGVIVSLTSDNPAVGGTVTIRGDVEGSLRQVRVALDAASYSSAIQAHEDRALVTVGGELTPEGKSLRLLNGRDFARVGDE
jgi:hypothetical protein